MRRPKSCPTLPIPTFSSIHPWQLFPNWRLHGTASKTAIQQRNESKPMKIVLAPNALKGCLTATQAADAMARGVARACPTASVVRVPVADGGDGLADVLVNALGGETLTVTVTAPRGDPVQASFCHVPTRRLAVIEMAAASGLALLARDRLNPLLTTILCSRRNCGVWRESGTGPGRAGRDVARRGSRADRREWASTRCSACARDR